MDLRALRRLLEDAARLRAYRARKPGGFGLATRIPFMRDRVRKRALAQWPGGYVSDNDGRLWYLPAPLDAAGGAHLLKPGDLSRLGGVSRFAVRLCKPGDTVLDVGANLGDWTVAAAEAVGPGGAVLAFEPHPAVADALARTLAVNRLGWARVFRQALAAEAGKSPFSIERENSGGSRLGRMQSDVYRGKRRTFEHIEVSVATIDGIVADERPARVDVIKIDTEGHENEVLRGARATLRQHKPALLMETGHESDAARREIAETLRGCGYRIAAFFLGEGAVEASWDDYLDSASLRKAGLSDMLCLHGAARA